MLLFETLFEVVVVCVTMTREHGDEKSCVVEIEVPDDLGCKQIFT